MKCPRHHIEKREALRPDGRVRRICRACANEREKLRTPRGPIPLADAFKRLATLPRPQA